jgi:hypothetical protein
MGSTFVRRIMSHPASEYPNDVILSATFRVTERRLVPRHRTSKVARIILHQGRPDILCTVRNISPAGGLLFVVNAHSLPEQFDLQIDDYGRRCLARWHRLDRIGVKFKLIARA